MGAVCFSRPRRLGRDTHTCHLLPQRWGKDGRFTHSLGGHERQSRGAPVSRPRTELHAASLYPGKGDFGGALVGLLFRRYSFAAFPSSSRPRPPRWGSGVYPRCWLDDFGRSDTQRRRDDSRALDLDGCHYWSLAVAYGLLDFAARHGTRTRDSPPARNFRCNGGRGGGRNRGDLSFRAAGRRVARHLSKVWIPSSG